MRRITHRPPPGHPHPTARSLSTPVSEPLPQLWELGMDTDDLTAQAAGLAQAELADVGLADRLRGWRGRLIRVDLVDSHIAATVQAVFRDAVLLTSTDADRLVTLTGVRAVAGPVAPAIAPTGRERGSGLSVCRQWLGLSVATALGDGMVVSGELAGVGADHLQFTDGGVTRLVPWHSVSWVRGPA